MEYSIAYMEIRSLEIFIASAELLHFGKASRICNLSPSALTRTIQRLEEQVGQPLFMRDNRSVALTDAGQKLLDYARSAVQDWRHFQESLSKENAVSGPLSIYASITAVYSLLPNLLEQFRSTYPSVHLELRTGAAEQAIEQVLRGEIDIAVAALPEKQQAALEFLPLTETPLVFIASTQVAESDIPTYRNQLDLSRAPLVVPQSGLSRVRLNQWLKKKGFAPSISSEVSGNEAIIAMVRLGCGIGMVPELVLERSPFRDEVRIIPNAPKLDPYVVGLCVARRNLKRPAVQALWTLASAL